MLNTDKTQISFDWMIRWKKHNIPILIAGYVCFISNKIQSHAVFILKHLFYKYDKNIYTFRFRSWLTDSVIACNKGFWCRNQALKESEAIKRCNLLISCLHWERSMSERTVRTNIYTMANAHGARRTGNCRDILPAHWNTQRDSK